MDKQKVIYYLEDLIDEEIDSWDIDFEEDYLIGKYIVDTIRQIKEYIEKMD